MGSDKLAEKGWIKLHRKILDCWIWNNKPYDKARAWIDLLLLANHSDKKILFNGSVVTISKGQYLTSIRNLSTRWGWSYDKCLRFLNLLETEEMLQKESDNTRTLLTIVNYEVYQDVPNTDKCTNRTPISEPTEHQQVTNKNVKNDKNIKNNNIGRFTPPNVEQVREYCKERNNNVDAEAFVDFYTSKNWMVGKNKMKDWKAAIRTWERNRTQAKPKVAENKFSNFEGRSYDMSSLEQQLLSRK